MQQENFNYYKFRDTRTQSVNVTFRFVNFNTKTLNFRGDVCFRHYLKVCEIANSTHEKNRTYLIFGMGFEPGTAAWKFHTSTAVPTDSCTKL